MTAQIDPEKWPAAGGDRSPPPSRLVHQLFISAILLSTALWWLAVFLPVWWTRTRNGVESVPGALPAFIGFLGIFVYCPAWYANLLLVPLAFVFPFFKSAGALRNGFRMSIVAFVIALSAFAFPAIYGDNEAAVIIGRRIGFFVWLASFIVVAFAYAMRTGRSERPVAFAAILAGGMFALMVPLEVIFRWIPLARIFHVA